MDALLDRIRRWWTPARIDPNEPHQFRSVDSVAAMGAAGAADTASSMGANAASMAVVSDANRGRCRLPGCGRPADDPIHQ